MTKITFHKIGEDGILRMAAMEAATWGSLGATEATIRQRLSLGHIMIAAVQETTIAGAVCFVETAHDPRDKATFPATFSAYSSLTRSVPPNSLYVYNLGVRPEFRGTPLSRRLLAHLVDYGREAGTRWIVGDGRCPSYGGAQEDSPDKVEINADFRRTIDEWHRTGIMPSVGHLTQDPLLNFYHRILKCEFLHLAPAFLPEDVSSGGYRVIFAVDLCK
ncbi:GNAT family N-acetyltransferase [Mesorhizobium sp. CA12]|uniref:GNAT family N-acetyltransferase n=1 Tax=Mesorhizobium sp. CA12 TaxID=2876644 RepID=UPI001CCDEC86|nr:GNAT family N-acetyltransferase [Mesorhizobium sp. CA12]MBZ9859363.1 GNAT family N-acetyltransferase [Mesorhizobium sp. CA12]